MSVVGNIFRNMVADVTWKDIDFAANTDFFLWHLWFAEVFDNGGFDIVIGNPPYIRPHHLPPETKRQLWSNFATYEKKADIYVCFMEMALRLAKMGGVVSFIVSDGWLRLDSFEKIREHLLTNATLRFIVDFTEDVFDSATVKTCILQMIKGVTENNNLLVAVVDNHVHLDKLPMRAIPQMTFGNTFKKVFDLSIDEQSTQIKQKLISGSTPLGQNFELAFGVKTGDDDKFLTFNLDLSPDCRKLVRGADIGRWSIDFKGEYVIYQPLAMRHGTAGNGRAFRATQSSRP